VCVCVCECELVCAQQISAAAVSVYNNQIRCQQRRSTLSLQLDLVAVVQIFFLIYWSMLLCYRARGDGRRCRVSNVYSDSGTLHSAARISLRATISRSIVITSSSSSNGDLVFCAVLFVVL
jgi:hypothetical protein